ncbi:MAG: PAS domain-containing protein, partial [bacterium]
MQNRDFGTDLRDIGRRLEDERLSHSDSVMVAPVGVTDLREPEFLQAQVYWHECRKEKSMPARADIVPMRLPRILSKGLLIDVRGASPVFRVRGVGTQ